MDAPRLIIVAEHDTCIHTQQWMTLLHLFALQLNRYPHLFLQIRAKTKSELRSWAYRTLPNHPRICVNDPVDDISPKLVHIPQSRIHPAPKQPFGMSIHHHDDPMQYDVLSPLYYQLGPIYSPISKIGTPQGLELIRQAHQRTSTPIIAVGGITPSNTKDVINAGAHGISSCGYLLTSKEPAKALHKLYTALHDALAI